MHAPDGMGADRYNERQNMKESRQLRNQPGPKFHVHAIDESGDSLFITESCYLREQAEKELADIQDISSKFPEGVDDYEIRED